MATTAGTILSAALNRSTANDGGRSELGGNSVELLGVLSRLVQRVYTMAALPRPFGGLSDGGFFARTFTVTLGTPSTTPVPLPSTIGPWTGTITEAGGADVARVTTRDVVNRVAEIPPAVIVQDGAIRSAGRLGDPTDGAVLTLVAAPMPPALTVTADYIGATTPGDAATTSWPGYVGDDWLIALLARYLAVKDGTRDAAELQALEADITATSQAFAAVLNVDAGELAGVRAA